MRGKGINYDTGFSPGGVSSREQFDAGMVRREMQVIADDLHCTAVRISGGNPARLSVAGELAAAGLEVWFAPFPCELAVLDGDYVREEHEQVTYLRELTEIFKAEGVDLAFWFTFAGYKFVSGPGSRRDLDLASCGVVRMVPGPGSGYQGLGWEPKLAFGALAQPADATQRAGDPGPVHYS